MKIINRKALVAALIMANANGVLAMEADPFDGSGGGGAALPTAAEGFVDPDTTNYKAIRLLRNKSDAGFEDLMAVFRVMNNDSASENARVAAAVAVMHYRYLVYATASHETMKDSLGVILREITKPGVSSENQIEAAACVLNARIHPATDDQKRQVLSVIFDIVTNPESSLENRGRAAVHVAQHLNLATPDQASQAFEVLNYVITQDVSPQLKFASAMSILATSPDDKDSALRVVSSMEGRDPSHFESAESRERFLRLINPFMVGPEIDLQARLCSQLMTVPSLDLEEVATTILGILGQRSPNSREVYLITNAAVELYHAGKFNLLTEEEDLTIGNLATYENQIKYIENIVRAARTADLPGIARSTPGGAPGAASGAVGE